MVERNIGIGELAIDGAEALDHDCLTNLSILVQRPFVIVATRSDAVPSDGVALGLADDDHSEHIQLFRIKLSKCRELDDLLLTPCLTHVAYWGVGAAMLGEDL